MKLFVPILVFRVAMGSMYPSNPIASYAQRSETFGETVVYQPTIKDLPPNTLSVFVSSASDVVYRKGVVIVLSTTEAFHAVMGKNSGLEFGGAVPPMLIHTFFIGFSPLPGPDCYFFSVGSVISRLINFVVARSALPFTIVGAIWVTLGLAFVGSHTYNRTIIVSRKAEIAK